MSSSAPDRGPQMHCGCCRVHFFFPSYVALGALLGSSIFDYVSSRLATENQFFRDFGAPRNLLELIFRESHTLPSSFRISPLFWRRRPKRAVARAVCAFFFQGDSGGMPVSVCCWRFSGAKSMPPSLTGNPPHYSHYPPERKKRTRLVPQRVLGDATQQTKLKTHHFSSRTCFGRCQENDKHGIDPGF